MNISDEQLVLNYQNGNHKALNLLIERHQKKIKNYIKSRIFYYETVDDLFQQTILNIITRINNFVVSKGSFSNWSILVAKSTIIDFIRYKCTKKNNNLSIDYEYDDERTLTEMLGNTCNQEQELASEEQKALVFKAIEEFFPKTNVIVMHRLNDLSFEEISKIEGIPKEKLRKHMHYLKIKMREIFKDF